MRSAELTISTVGQRPTFVNAAADRIWRAWWQPAGYEFRHVQALVQASVESLTVPQVFVAHRAGLFVGTVSLIENDLAERAALSPWLAALWVDEEHRRRGVAASLLEAGRAAARRGDRTCVYLCAREHLVPFYERLGWSVQERDVGPKSLAVLMSDLD